MTTKASAQTLKRPQDTGHPFDIDVETLVALYPPNEEPTPVPLYQVERLRESMWMLATFFERRLDVVLGDNNNVYCYDANGELITVAPDVFIAFGVQNRDESLWDGSYFVGRDGRPSPIFVMEIGSESTWANDLTDKMDMYAGMGVPEYWLLDVTGGRWYKFPLKGYRLVDDVYVEIEMTNLADGSTRGHSESLGLDLCWEDGDIRLYDPATCGYLLNRKETQSALEAAEVENARLRALLAERE